MRVGDVEVRHPGPDAAVASRLWITGEKTVALPPFQQSNLKSFRCVHLELIVETSIFYEFGWCESRSLQESFCCKG